MWLFGLVVGLICMAVPGVPEFGRLHLAVAAVSGCALLAWRPGLILSGLCLGLAWGAHNTQVLLDSRLPACVSGLEHQLLVEVLDDPQPGVSTLRGPRSLRFRGLVHDDADAGRCQSIAGAQVRLSWYRPPESLSMRRGERWWLQSRVKPPWGYQNPAGFDFERWLLSNHLQGTGYVLGGRLVTPVDPTRLDKFRHRLRTALSAGYLGDGAILYALVSGDGSGVAPEQWVRFRATGTIHLMVVSGLHVGLVAALGFLAGGWLARLVPGLLLWLPAKRAGAVAGLAAAAAFVVFTGSGVPALRALCMAAVAFVAVIAGRRIRATDLLLLALAAVLVLDPLAVHQQGFWLSFSAVLALILYFSGLHQPGAAWRSLWTTQMALFIGLSPLLAAWYGQVPMVGMVANMLVVPVMSVVVIPLALVSMLLLTASPELAGFGFYLADQVLGLLLELLDALAAAPALQVVAQPRFVALAVTGGALLLIGGPWRWRLVLWLVWWSWCLPPDAAIPEKEFRVTALDVGQGSAILVDTHRHRLLFDAGPSYPSGFDLGAAAVVPSIRATGRGALDVMVLSHADIDHRGGAASVRTAVPVATIFESAPGPDSELCRSGVSWTWDGVMFRFLSPVVGHLALNDNDGSCVLEVANSRERVLLPGDISTAVEWRLLRDVDNVRLLFAPHHGSNGSSSTAFVRILDPDVVFVSAGKGNRYGHPHPAVIERYRAIGADLHVTGESGALVWESRWPKRVLRFRHDRAAYWTTGRER